MRRRIGGRDASVVDSAAASRAESSDNARFGRGAHCRDGWLGLRTRGWQHMAASLVTSREFKVEMALLVSDHVVDRPLRV